MRRVDRFGRGIVVGIFSTLACCLVFAAVLVFSLYHAGYANAFFPEKNNTHKEKTDYGIRDAETCDKLALLQDYIDAYFLYEPDQKTVGDSLYRALLDSLEDPYSVYYDEEEFQSFQESSSGPAMSFLA